MVLLGLLVALTGASPASASVSADTARIVALVNEERKDAGLAPLRRASDMDAVSQAWAEKMAATGDFRHNPNYGTEITNWSNIAENIAQHWEVDGAHTALMESRGHRENILGPYTEIGVGVAWSSGGLVYVVETFRTPTGGTQATRAPSQEKPRQETDRQAAERQAAERQAAERQAAERAEAERQAAERAEAERRAAERAEAERQAAERQSAERQAAERAEAERQATERQAAERQVVEPVPTAAPVSEPGTGTLVVKADADAPAAGADDSGSWSWFTSLLGRNPVCVWLLSLW